MMTGQSMTNVTETVGLVTMELRVYVVDKLIDDSIRQIWYVVLKCALYELFSALGLITNAVNMAVFWVMGCHDSSGVTMISLTLSDIINLLVLLWMGICYNPLFTYADISFDTQSVVYLSGGWLKIYISRVTSWITAFLSLERCLCIAMPLRVSRALTKSRSIVVNVFIFVVVFSMLPPIYSTTYLNWQWFPDRNRTLLGLAFSDQREDVYDSVASVNVVMTMASFLVILGCTAMLVVSLNKQARWRSSLAASKSGPSLSSSAMASTKELRINKTIVMIAALFIACYFPGTVVLLVMVFMPEFNKGMLYNNLFTVVWAFIHILEAWNSTFNIFIYYGMSSKFRSVLYRMFRLPCKSERLRKNFLKHDIGEYHSGIL